MKPVIEEEKRKFSWFYQFKISKEARDRFEGKRLKNPKDQDPHRKETTKS